MPRLSIFKPEKGNDYKFFDRNIKEMFQVGGTDLHFHKYLGPYDQGDTNKDGPASPSQPRVTGSDLNETTIQDLLFLENRDRKYADDIYIVRGIYNVQDADFNLSQFGMFLQNDTLFLTVHLNDIVERIGRKPMSGDVIEFPHMKEDYSLDESVPIALKRYYVVEDVNRAAEGFSVTWYPHLYRAKCKPLVDSQEFKGILDQIADSENFKGTWNPDSTYYPGDTVTAPNGQQYTVTQEVTGTAPPDTTYYKLADTLKDIMSTYEKEMQITKAVEDQANADTPQSGYDTTKLYTLQQDETGKTELVTADGTIDDADIDTVTADTVFQSAEANGYKGYLIGDGIPPNGAPFTQGIAFPMGPAEGQFHLRTDYKPTRLFRFAKGRWSKVEDDVRTNITNLGPSDTAAGKDFAGDEKRETQKTSFINNTNQQVIDGQTVKERQSLSKALKPKADE